jgi:hypothetical protein
MHAAGAAASGLYLEDGVKYKIILKDSAGATVTTQDDVRCPQFFHNQTAGEVAAGVTPTNYQYEAGDVRRYGDNTTPGTTVMDTPITNAFAANAGKVIFQNEEYVLNSLVTVTNDVVVYGNGALISGDGRLLFQGATSDADTTLSAATVVGDQTFTVASAGGLAVDDLIRLTDPANSSWSPYSTSDRAGEFQRITEISGTTITTSGLIRDVYPITTGEVDVLTPIQVDISNLTITTGEVTHNEPLHLQRCANSRLSNVKAFGGKWRAINIDQCFNVRVDSCEGYHDAPAVGFNYGIQLVDCEACVVDGGYFYGRRHGATMGSGGIMPTRNCVVENAELANRAANSGAADFHAASTDSSYVNCRIHNQCYVAGKDNKYVHCRITQERDDSAIGYLNPVGGTLGYYHCKVDLATGQNFAQLMSDIASGGSTEQTVSARIEYIDNDLEINSNVTRIASHTYNPDTGNPGISYIHKNNRVHGDISGLTGYAIFTINQPPTEIIIQGNNYDDTVINVPQIGSVSGTSASDSTIRWSIDQRAGTWTPTYVATSTDFDSVTYDAITVGNWRRFDDLVFVEGILRTDAITVGSATGSVVVGGLPFTVAAPTNDTGSVAISQVVTWAGDHPDGLTPRANTKHLLMRYRTSANGGSTNIAVADLGTGANANELRFSGWYTTSDNR